MGKQTSGFSLPGFVRLAPSIYVQDAKLGLGGYNTNHEPMYSNSSFCLPAGPAAQLSSRSRDTPPPGLIIITSWTGAASKHVAKYTEAYNTLYPGVPILVITTVVADLVLHSTNHKLQVLAPAIDYLLSHEPIPSYQPDHTSLHSYDAYYPPPQPQTSKPRFPSLLLHAFSEGGAHKAVLLARAYQQYHQQHHPNPPNPTPPPPSRLPVEALILDSTPGTASYTRATTAFARALPGGSQGTGLVGRVLAPAAAAGVVGVMWAGLRVRGRYGNSDLIAATRLALNDGGLWDLGRMARTYLFGEGDAVVWWGDVHRHGVESAAAAGGGVGDGGDAAAAGLGVEGEGGDGGDGGGVGSLMVRFKRTEHCAHAKGVVNGAVYWAAVRRTWEMREDRGMGLRMGLGRRLSLDSLCRGEEDEYGR
ncbi:uncharacterized protein B0H64DRAFT_425784 [Chaetomium fimeti]|uniref:Uncharacterized protein n=1 Tax=Chaetomium fimeti TaxID=1854472 RepID=A0AAE0HAK9_9PEZI|nr:hypothetical protein B0H64DRAFT_425784 [Chaetomium fimeti]